MENLFKKTTEVINTPEKILIALVAGLAMFTAFTLLMTAAFN